MASEQETTDKKPPHPREERGYCQFCHGKREGVVEYERVGPNLPQHSIRFTCDDCGGETDRGILYIYDRKRWLDG